MAVQLTGLIEWQPGWLSSLLVWLNDCQDGCPIYWFDWVTARMAVQITGLIEWQPGWLVLRMAWDPVFPGSQVLGGIEVQQYAVGPPDMDIEVHLICGGTARYGHWGPIICGRTARYGHWAPILGCGTTIWGHWGPKCELGKLKNEFWGPNLDFWGLFQDQNDF